LDEAIMNPSTREALWSLTEKEKQTLRLIVRGHDAKSAARSLGLSVHTINERLRDARRKMAVSSSREAARLLLEAEGGTLGPGDPQKLGYVEIGDDPGRGEADRERGPTSGAGSASRLFHILIGVLPMTLAFGLLALFAYPQVAPILSPAPAASAATVDAAVLDAARQWLALLDQGKWDESYRATGAAFRKLNTPEVWAAASVRVRVPLGAMVSRTFVSQENLPAPPQGYEVVKFRTRYANREEATETVTLEREGDQWRVVGATVA
jgi:DNA-binding CsgD family transcriptional regulator